jgi:hypothetical protein
MPRRIGAVAQPNLKDCAEQNLSGSVAEAAKPKIARRALHALAH